MAILANRNVGIQVAVLIAVSLLLVAALSMLRLPAALLLGPMAAAILLAANGLHLRVPRRSLLAAQALIGCLVARGIDPSIVGELSTHWPLFLTTLLAVIASSSVLGWLLARWRVLPGTAAVWGSSPGAATVMTLMAGAYGADIRLVAFMQYTRVVAVALAASLMARYLTTAPLAGQAAAWFPALSWPSFLATLALAGLGGFAGQALRIPAGSLLVPLVLGAVLHGAGGMRIELPPLLLAASYTIVGWHIGLSFTPAILAHAARAFPRVAASILAQISLCGGLAFLLTQVAGVDALSAYLATSPGGVDTVAIIAASSKVDVSFVMALQTLRLLLVLAIGPSLAGFVARRTGITDESR